MECGWQAAEAVRGPCQGLVNIMTRQRQLDGPSAADGAGAVHADFQWFHGKLYPILARLFHAERAC
jgi:hypothetical protein